MREKTLSVRELIKLAKGRSLPMFFFAMLALTVFFLVDDVIYYLLAEKFFHFKLGALPKFTLVAVIFFANLALAILVVKAMLRKPVSGAEAMIGACGVATKSIRPGETGGWVRVRGELWKAVAKESIGSGENIEVTAVEGLVLHVKSPPPILDEGAFGVSKH
jgi:membrane-bound serine protease (ClpP class)